MAASVRSVLGIAALLVACALPHLAVAQMQTCGPMACGWDPIATSASGGPSFTTLTTWPGGLAMSWSMAGGPKYRDFTLAPGQVYEWSMCEEDGGDSSGDALVLMDPVTKAPLCRWEEFGPCGNLRIRYRSELSTSVRIMVTGAVCDYEMGGGELRWRCVSCADNGCTDAPNGESPSGVFTPSCTGAPELITTNAPAGTYSSVQLTAGTPYTFSAVPLSVVYETVGAAWITITDATGTIIYGHAQGVRNFTPPTTGVYRFYSNLTMVGYGCDTFVGDHRAIRCGALNQCNNVIPIPCETEQLLYMAGSGSSSWTSGACGATAGGERIYLYTPTVTGVYRLDITNGLDLTTAIRYAWKPASLGCDASNWNCLGTATGFLGQFTFNLTAGVPIYILADAVTTGPIWQRIVLRCDIPQNQTCASAAPVNTYPATLTANARWSTGSIASACLNSPAQTLWYKAVGVCGTMTARTCGSEFNTYLSVFSGTCGNLTEVVCNNNATAGPCSGTQQSFVSWTAQQGVDYYVVVGHQAQGNQSMNVVLNITANDADNDGIGDACEVRPNVRVMLDGPYDSSTGLMKDGIRTLGQLQLIEPYTNMNYPHVNGGGESTTLPVVSVGGNNAIVDWVVIELRSATTPTLVVDTRSALLQRDGDIVDVDGVSPVNMRSASGDYYVAIRHRNHLAVMTSTPVALSPTSALLDFTNVATGTYGIQALRTTGGVFSKQVMWCGDVDSNGTIKYTGEVNDRDPVLMMIGGVIPTNTVITYSFSDLNMDGVVKYTGEDNDRDRVLSTIGGTVPTNTRVQQLP